MTRAATGTASAINSGAVTTTNPTDLLFAGAASGSSVNKAGTGWTSRSSSFGNRTEDRNVTSAGSYSATATQNGNTWVMQLVAFKADATPDPPASGPAAAYAFDEGSGTTAADASGHGLTGTLVNGPTWTPASTAQRSTSTAPTTT